MNDSTITVNTDKAGWQNFNFQVGDTVVLDKGRLFQITKVESTTSVTMRPASRWSRLLFWFSEMAFELKMYWWTLKRKFK